MANKRLETLFQKMNKLKLIIKGFFDQDNNLILIGSFFRIFLVIIISIFVNVAVTLYTISTVQRENKELRVPNLLNNNLLEATYKIEQMNQNLNKKINLNIVSVATNQHIKYTVFDQYPQPGMKIREGRTLNIKVSKGISSHRVANYIGQPFKKVKQALYADKIADRAHYLDLKNEINTLLHQKNKKEYIILNEVKEVISKTAESLNREPVTTLGNVIFTNHSTTPAGYIIDQKPKPGIILNDDTPINFVVSLGIKQSYINVKSFTKQPVEKVVKYLESNNIHPILSTVSSSANNQGIIIKQSVKPGKKLYSGDYIHLEVGSNGSLNQQYKMIQFIIPDFFIIRNKRKPIDPNKPVRIKLVIEDQNNETIIFEGMRLSGEKIVECIKVDQPVKLKVFLNDKAYQVKNIN